MGGKIHIIISLLGIFSGCLSIGGAGMIAQENPPFPVEVEIRNEQHLSFGSFTVGANGGSVVVDISGSRIPSDDVILLNTGLSVSYALFDVYANPGTIIHITGITSDFSGPSNDVFLEFDITRDTSTGRTFVTTTNPHPLRVGGKLVVPSTSSKLPGNYGGIITLIVNYE